MLEKPLEIILKTGDHRENGFGGPKAVWRVRHRPPAEPGRGEA